VSKEYTFHFSIVARTVVMRDLDKINMVLMDWLLDSRPFHFTEQFKRLLTSKLSRNSLFATFMSFIKFQS